MRRLFLTIFSVVVCCVAEVSAQQIDYYGGDIGRYRTRPRSSVEMGIMAGASYMSSSASAVGLAPHSFGIRGGLSMSLCWSEEYALQMELAYLYNEIEATKGSFATDVESNIMEIPLLFSYRGLGPVRLNVGPVLSLAGTARYDAGSERVEFGRVRSTIGYVAGVGVELSRHLLLDARFVGNFAAPSNYFEGAEFSSPYYWVVLSLGYMF
ncbi:MAG: outer membrane beta-barrel protein [Alistipes sp.]|nr:outer membrane beta-barrel protein [Alistipes sp.]